MSSRIPDNWMKVHGTPSKASEILKKEILPKVPAQRRKKITRFLCHYCHGLNQIELIPDYSVRESVRTLFRDKRAEECVERFSDDLGEEITFLLNTLDYHFKKNLRKDFIKNRCGKRRKIFLENRKNGKKME